MEKRQDDAFRWPMSVSVVMQQVYAADDETLNGIYAKGKRQQWNVDDYDWSHTLDPDNPLRLPDATLLIAGTDLWRQLSPERQAEARRHFQSWSLSQILHGEQAALVCAAKLAQGESNPSARQCSALQVADEARHVEAYARLVNEKLGIMYPMSGSLRGLVEDTIRSNELDFTNLGMQILIEGLALSKFQVIVAYGGDPFIKELIGKIQKDESRHFATGRITLERLYRHELSSAEIRRREQYLAESIAVLYEHLCADDIWEPLGHQREQCSRLVRDSKIADALRRNLFRRLVPTIRDIGLSGPTVIKALEQFGLADYVGWPSVADA